MWESTNPALNNDAFDAYYGKDMFAAKSNVTTLQGVVNKTLILVGIATATGAVGYWAVGQNTSILWISNIAAFLVALGLYFVIHGKPQLSPILAPIYAVVEGLFLGALTGAVESILLARGIEIAGGVALQAFLITASILLAMLTLYKARIIQPTNTLKAVVCTATTGIMITYLLSWLLSFFGIQLPFITFSSAFETDPTAGLIGLGVNLLVLGVASLWLVIDFGMIEEKLNSAAPKYMEWYCGYALLVSLAWIYYESLKLIVRLASLFGSRD